MVLRIRCLRRNQRQEAFLEEDLVEVKQRLETLGFAPIADTPDDFGARIKTEIAKWSKVVHDANIRAD